MEFMEYIKPELVVLAVALYGLGMLLKMSEKIKDKMIPLLLIVAGIVLATIWVLATSVMQTYQDWLMAIFTSVVQGILCAAAAVLANQVYKQSKKVE